MILFQLTNDPAIPLLGIYLGKNMIQKDICAPVVTAALFTIAKTCTHAKLSNFSCVQLFVTLCAEPCWISQARILEWVVSPSPLNLPDSGIETTSLTSAKTWKQPICPLTEEWIKMWYIYTVEYYFEKE